MVLILHRICYKLIYWRYKNTQHLMAKVLKYPTVIIHFFFMYPRSTLFNRLNISILLFFLCHWRVCGSFNVLVVLIRIPFSSLIYFSLFTIEYQLITCRRYKYYQHCISLYTKITNIFSYKNSMFIYELD